MATLANWLFSWLVTLTANMLLDWSSGGLCALMHVFSLDFILFYFLVNQKLPLFLSGTFTIYAVVCALTVVFVTIWVPETKGKTIEEIQWSFR